MQDETAQGSCTRRRLRVFSDRAWRGNRFYRAPFGLPSQLISSDPFRWNKARRKFSSKAPGLELVDEPHNNRYPTPA